MQACEEEEASAVSLDQLLDHLVSELEHPKARALPPDGPRERWACDWRGGAVNLYGMRPGSDGAPVVITVIPKRTGDE